MLMYHSPTAQVPSTFPPAANAISASLHHLQTPLCPFHQDISRRHPPGFHQLHSHCPSPLPRAPMQAATLPFLPATHLCHQAQARLSLHMRTPHTLSRQAEQLLAVLDMLSIQRVAMQEEDIHLVSSHRASSPLRLAPTRPPLHPHPPHPLPPPQTPIPNTPPTACSLQ